MKGKTESLSAFVSSSPFLLKEPLSRDHEIKHVLGADCRREFSIVNKRSSAYGYERGRKLLPKSAQSVQSIRSADKHNLASLNEFCRQIPDFGHEIKVQGDFVPENQISKTGTKS